MNVGDMIDNKTLDRYIRCGFVDIECQPNCRKAYPRLRWIGRGDADSITFMIIPDEVHPHMWMGVNP